MATNVHLTPELERFARECVKRGRYNNVSEVVRSGLRLLQEAEERRRQFLAMLRESEAEADRDGSVGIDDVLSDIDKIVTPRRR
jgi:antitoxin ParD1/3/4